jgi:uncharacterized protein (DUF1501 family)
MNRRSFFRTTALAGMMVWQGGWVARSQTPKGKRFVVIFLRGAVDGLSLVVPYTSEIYYRSRPRIAIPTPSQPGGCLDLNGEFGMHPAFAPLLPLWQNRSLGFVHAAGSQDTSRSHFDAQAVMESGGDPYRIRDGWMNRLLGVLPNPSPVQAIAVGATVPRMLTGKLPVASLAAGRGVPKSSGTSPLDQLYGDRDPLSLAYQEAATAIRGEMHNANQGAPLPNGCPGDAVRLARLMRQDPSIQLAFMDLGGWDTHVNQGASEGLLANRLQPLAQGLASFATELGSVFKDTMVMVVSEFGRTLHENGNGGTDHGHGNVIWLLGGNFQGGQVCGTWPGLNPENLYQQRDLAVTTDYREVLSGIFQNHLKLPLQQSAQVLTGFSPSLTGSSFGL